MTNTMRKAVWTGLASIGAIALLAGCGQAPTTTPSAGATDAPAASDFKACIVSDAGGFDDKSFNQSSFEGLQDAAKALGLKTAKAESDGENTFGPNVQSMVDQNCNIITTVGYLLADATEEAAKANPETNFLILDYADIDAENVKPVVYDTAQAAFLAGYAAADYSKTGVVGTYGGMKLPTVTIFMDGFVEGVKHYNEVKGKDVKVLGWDVDKQDGSFTNGFDANDVAKQAATSLLEQDVDVLMPVGGPIFISAIAAIEDSKKDVALIGVDADVFLTADRGNELFFTSVMKQMRSGTEQIVTEASKGEFDNSPYIGTLENEGVGLAPFHDFESKISATLQAELDEVTKGIIDGSIKAVSPASPK